MEVKPLNRCTVFSVRFTLRIIMQVSVNIFDEATDPHPLVGRDQFFCNVFYFVSILFITSNI